MIKKLFPFFLFPLPIFASGDPWTYYAWGDGEGFEKTFNAIAALFSEEFYSGAIFVSAIIGLVGFVSVIVSKGKTLSSIMGWPLATYLLLNIGFIPSTVRIYDALAYADIKSPRVSVVDNVPLFASAPACLLSSISYGATKKYEEIFHKSNDPLYNWTGSIFAGQSLYNMRKMRLIDGTTEQNFREFCRECISRDLKLGLYTREELQKAPQLLNFLKEKSSNIRGCIYRYPKKLTVSHTYSAEKEGKTEIDLNGAQELEGARGQLSCKKAIQQIALNINGNLLNLRSTLEGAIGNEFAYLVDKSNSAPIMELVAQQIAIDTVRDYTSPTETSLAAAKARLHQNTTNKFLGIFAAADIVALRNDLLQILIALTPILALFCAVKGGFSLFGNLCKFYGWLGFWPILYVVINFKLDRKWAKGKELFGFSTDSLTLGISDGFLELWQQQQSTASVLLAMIPPFSWAILHLSTQGVHALVSTLSGVSAASQGAASAAAAEEVTGNYSYQNVGLRSRSVGQQSFYQQSNSPVVAYGSLTTADSYGALQTNTWGDDNSLTEKQNISSATTGINFQQMMGSAHRQNVADQKQIVDENSQNLSTSVSQTSTSGMTLHKGLAQDHSFGHLKNHSDQMQAQQLWGETQQAVNEFSNLTKITGDEAVNASIGLGVGKLGASYPNRWSKMTDEQHRNATSLSHQIAENYQKLAQYSVSDSSSDNMTDTQRAAQDFSQNYTQAESYGEAHRIAESNLQTAMAAQETFENKQQGVSRNYANEWRQSLQAQYKDKGKVQRIIDDPILSLASAENFCKDQLPQAQTTLPPLQKAPEIVPSTALQNAGANHAQIPQEIKTAHQTMKNNYQNRSKEFGIKEFPPDEGVTTRAETATENATAENLNQQGENLRETGATALGGKVVKTTLETAKETAQPALNFVSKMAKMDLMLNDPHLYIQTYGYDDDWSKAHPNLKHKK